MRNMILYSTRGMLSICALALVLLITGGMGKAQAETQWSVGVSGDERGITGFDLSVGEYYDVPEREVVVIHDRGIDEEDLPVVFFLSRHAHVAPGVIVDLRLRGMSWMDITLHYGLGPEIYYVPVTVVHYPHGHAYGYYKKHRHHDDWRKIRLRDRDIVDQVNLKFMTEHYRYSPEKIMKYREQGRRFPVINQEIWRDHHTRGGERYSYGGRPYRKDLARDRQYDQKYYRSAPQKRDRQDVKKYDRTSPQKGERQVIQKNDRSAPRDRGDYQAKPQTRNKNMKMEGKDDWGHGKQEKRGKD